jgi:phosphoenolpyruvate-protein kinase (PTS system EI component)
MELMKLGVRVPPTVSVEIDVHRFQGVEETRSEVQQIVRCGIDELEQIHLNMGCGLSKGQRIIARWQLSYEEPFSWRPAYFEVNDESGHDANERMRSLEGDIALWALGSTDVPTAPTLRFLLQGQIGLTGGGAAKGWLWHDVASGPRAGIVQRWEGASYLGWSSFREWSQTQDGPPEELLEWLRIIHAAHPEVPQLRLCFGTLDQKAYALSLHAQPVSTEERLRHVAAASRQGALSSDQAILSLGVHDLERRVRLSCEQRSKLKLLARGHQGGDRFVQGRAAFDEANVQSLHEAGDPVVLLTESLEPRDVAAIANVAGIVSLRGGPSSHAIVVARGSGVATLLGAQGLLIDSTQGQAHGHAGATVKAGDWLVIDGVDGALYAGRVKEEDACDDADGLVVRRWVMNRAGSTVRANADRADDVRRAVRMHAPGIGLCRSENHLLEPPILRAFQRYVLCTPDHRSDDQATVVASLRDELSNVLRAADGRWVHYRLLDPRFDELLPEPETQEARQLAAELGKSPDMVADRLRILRRSRGGMLGERGCRWGLRSGFYKDQLTAVASAVRAAASDMVQSVRLALVVPLVIDVSELSVVRELAEQCLSLSGERVELKFGCMIETARAAIMASELASNSDVLCFGTNDLTQSVWGLSRDEGLDVLSYYQRTGILTENPFEVVDRRGLGKVVETALAEIGRANPRAEKVICGEQAADPESAAYFVEIGANAVSCRPSSMAQVALVVSQQKIREENDSGNFHILRESRAEALCDGTCSRIRRGLVAGRSEASQDEALSWAAVVSSRVGLGLPKNWKFFKRDLVAKWFGPREHKRFDADWTTDDVLEAAREYGSGGRRTVRCSIFPDMIACHSVSKALPPMGDEFLWREIVDSLDKSAPIEVFPQQGSNQLCFRAVVTQGRTIVEAGVGQAMYVFEEERGTHPVAIAELNWNGPSSPSGPAGAPIRELSALIEHWGEWLLVRLTAASTTLGTQWLGIEGYYETGDECREPFVCDIDLPLDMAFHSEMSG